MKKVGTALLALAMAISITGFCFSFDKKGTFTSGSKNASWWKNDSIVEKLNLTDAQTQKLEEIKYIYGKKMIQANSNLDIAKIDFKYKLSKDEVDTEVIDNCISEVSKAHKQILENKVYKKLALKKILSKEQLDLFKKELKTLMKEKRELGKKQKEKKFKSSIKKYHSSHK